MSSFGRLLPFLQRRTPPARTSGRDSRRGPVVAAAVENLESRVLLSAATVENRGVVDLNAYSTTLAAEVTSDGGKEVTERGIVVSVTVLNPSPSIDSPFVSRLPAPEGGTGQFQMQFQGTPRGEYSYRFYAINADGVAYSPAQALTFPDDPNLVVTTTADVVDANDGFISLREAVAYSETHAGADIIRFGGSAFGDATPDTITLTQGALFVEDSLTISGTGANLLSISGNHASRVFSFSGSIQIELSGLTIKDGQSSTGGAIFNNDATLLINDCVFTGNSATVGGAILSDGEQSSLQIRRSTFTDNHADWTGGAIHLENSGRNFDIEQSTISGNTAADGAGLFIGVTTSDVFISSSTLSGNVASGNGGGLFLTDNYDTVILVNCTISGNQATDGGGIFVQDSNSDVQFFSCTIYGNTASGQGGGILIDTAGIGRFLLAQTILSGNTASSAPSDLILNNSVDFTYISHNIIGFASLNTYEHVAFYQGNWIGYQIQLLPLTNNGGLTQTHALTSDSFARNAGTSYFGIGRDQRGVVRSDPPDIGAFELQAPILQNLESTSLYYTPGQPAAAVTSTLTVTTPLSITGATVRIDAGYQAGDVLTFANTANITGTYNAATRTLSLTGTDTAENYQAALRSIKYASTSQSAASRSVSFQVTDGVDSSSFVSRLVGGFAQVKNGQLTLLGTDQVNNFQITWNGMLTTVVDGVTTTLSSAGVTSIAIFGYGGNDQILIDSLPATVTIVNAYGMEGNDTIRVSPTVTSRVILNGAGGNDLLIGGGGNDQLLGGLGNDWLNGGGGSDALEGNSGDDVYAFSNGIGNELDTILGGDGDGRDALNFAAVTTSVTVNLLNQTAASMAQRLVRMVADGQQHFLEDVTGGSAGDTITGNANGNLLVGGGGGDVLYGLAGADQLDGGENNDLLYGGTENDTLLGGNGNDGLFGDAGNDVLVDGEGSDSLGGGLGNDTYLFAAAQVNQVDTVAEVAGTDTLNFQSLTTPVTVNLNSAGSLASMYGRIVKASSVVAAQGFENAIGGSGNDSLAGNSASNLLKGNDGNDTLVAVGGIDILLGGLGNDVLRGTSGWNLLIGGAGGDILDGGTGQDLMVASSLTFENDETVLRLMLAEWSSNLTSQTRINHLLGTTSGGINGGFTLKAATVLNDPGVDYLKGNADQDWFVASGVIDVLQDRAVDEVFTKIEEL